MKKSELIEKLTGVEMTLNGIVVNYLFKIIIDSDLLNELLEVSNDVRAIREGIERRK